MFNNKEELLKSYNKTDKLFLSNILDKMNKVETQNYTVTTSFLDINETKLAISLLNKFKLKYKVFDVNNTLERKVLAILSDYEEGYLFDEIKCVKITPKTKNKLLHKDYMGMLYNCGIAENKIGDILVIDDICYMFTFTSIFEYLKLNIDKVGNSKVEIEEINPKNIDLTKKFKEEKLVLPSKRIDVILAHLYNLSRNDVDKKISKGELIINSIKVLSKTKEINVDDIISFKKCGKFKIKNFDVNKKGKYITTIDIYC